MTNSDIHTMKHQHFGKPSAAEWRQAAEQSLKGRALDSLKTGTMEGITLDLLYTDRPAAGCVRPEGRGWTIAQGASGGDGREWLAAAQEGLEKGNETLYLDGTAACSWDDTALDGLALLITEAPIAWFGLAADHPVLKVFERIPADRRTHVKGLLATDDAEPLDGYPNVRTAGIDLTPLHMEGTDSATELAYALTAASECAEKSENFEQFADNAFFRFSADTHFFMEIAKFRAFRSLWQLFSSAYGIGQPEQVPLCAVTSLRSFSMIDPHVNLLRAGNSAFSAVLGGADLLTVLPFNELTGATAQSVRYARNMQLILREETHAAHTADPAGGAYFIEQLTGGLVEKAWKRFLQMQADGGTAAFRQSGAVGRQAAHRKSDAAVGKLRLIGTNVYADPDDQALLTAAGDPYAARPAYPFEQLRLQAVQHAPDIAIIPFGELAAHKPRTDFAAGFLAAAGLTARTSPAFDDGAEAAAWLAAQMPDYAILCAAPGKLEQVAVSVLEGAPEDIRIDIAGKPAEAEAGRWSALGLNGTIHAGQDQIAKLTEILSFTRGGETHENA